MTPVASGIRRAWPWPTLAWVDALEQTLPYLSIAVPFALVTTVGGITVVIRGDREVSDLTTSNGSFVITDAPTGDVTVILRRVCRITQPR